jgi:DNA invertase Pin-like site-specific DNA recombinase
VVIASAKESWLEMEGPVRPLLVAIFSWVAEQERARIQERTRAGMARAKAEGRSVGRPRAAITIGVARALLAEGKSMPKVAKRLGVGVDTLRRALARDDAA